MDFSRFHRHTDSKGGSVDREARRLASLRILSITTERKIIWIALGSLNSLHDQNDARFRKSVYMFLDKVKLGRANMIKSLPCPVSMLRRADNAATARRSRTWQNHTAKEERAQFQPGTRRSSSTSPMKKGQQPPLRAIHSKVTAPAHLKLGVRHHRLPVNTEMTDHT